MSYFLPHYLVFHTNAIRIVNSRYLHLNRFFFSVKQTGQQQIQFIDDFFKTKSISEFNGF